jgi:NDP-sugar pyrophosphorylase family protein
MMAWEQATDLNAQPTGYQPERGDSTGVVGVVLAGSTYRGDGAFERLLRVPLLSVAQRPVIAYVLDWLSAAGVDDVVICANNSTHRVRAHLGDGHAFGLRLAYMDDAQPRGAAGCVYDVAQRVAASIYLVVEGSLIPQFPLAELLDAHRRVAPAATVVVEVERRRAAVGTGRPRVPGGVYAIERRALHAVGATGYQDIKQGLLERLYANGDHVAGHDVPGVSPRILDYETYSSVSSWLIGSAGRRPDLFPGFVRIGDGAQHPSAVVHPRARLIGPVLLGPNTRVEADAVIVGPTTIGAGSIVQAAALVARSFVWERCVIGAGALVDGSLIADDVVVPAGTQRFDTVEVNERVWAGGPRPTPVRITVQKPVRVPPAVALPGTVSLSTGESPLAPEGAR